MGYTSSEKSPSITIRKAKQEQRKMDQREDAEGRTVTVLGSRHRP